jgi:mannose-1-phosphate guanylyltransferase/mannose-6-phosphate isomerase
VLHEVNGTKVKELTVEPGQSLSMQRHHLRSEYWLVMQGRALIHSQMPDGYQLPAKEIRRHEEFHVNRYEWHQLTNPYNKPCKIVEIQYGDDCQESDIERKDSSERRTI